MEPICSAQPIAHRSCQVDLQGGQGIMGNETVPLAILGSAFLAQWTEQRCKGWHGIKYPGHKLPEAQIDVCVLLLLFSICRIFFFNSIKAVVNVLNSFEAKIKQKKKHEMKLKHQKLFKIKHKAHLYWKKLTAIIWKPLTVSGCMRIVMWKCN